MNIRIKADYIMSMFFKIFFSIFVLILNISSALAIDLECDTELSKIAGQGPSNTVLANFVPPENVKVMSNDSELIHGDTKYQIGNAVIVERPELTYATGYNRTNRKREGLEYFYRVEKINPANLQGMKVLDVGMGGGAFVEELRAAGVEAFGLDIALSSLQMEHLYNGLKHDELDGLLLDSKIGKGHFVQADALHTHLASQQFDVVFSTYAIFEYNLNSDLKSLDFLKSVLEELKRISKVGGRILISPIYKGYSDNFIRDIVSRIPDLKISEITKANSDPESSIYFVEILRVK